MIKICLKQERSDNYSRDYLTLISFLGTCYSRESYKSAMVERRWTTLIGTLNINIGQLRKNLGLNTYTDMNTEIIQTIELFKINMRKISAMTSAFCR